MPSSTPSESGRSVNASLAASARSPTVLSRPRAARLRDDGAAARRGSRTRRPARPRARPRRDVLLALLACAAALDAPAPGRALRGPQRGRQPRRLDGRGAARSSRSPSAAWRLRQRLQRRLDRARASASSSFGALARRSRRRRTPTPTSAASARSRRNQRRNASRSAFDLELLVGEALADDLLVELADRRLRDLVDERPRVGQLPLGHLVGEVLLEVGGGRRPRPP